MAYVIETKQKDLSVLEKILPFQAELKNKEKVVLNLVQDEDEVKELNRILNEIIQEGISYPQENILNLEQFKAYYMTHQVFILKTVQQQTVVGAFYIKPNFPGRCDHFCNGGFIVDQKFRNQGAGRIMGSIYIQLAKLLGYRASFFNLVFENNPTALHLWRSLGFQELSVIPKVGRYTDKQGNLTYVNAHQFYLDLTSE